MTTDQRRAASEEIARLFGWQNSEAPRGLERKADAIAAILARHDAATVGDGNYWRHRFEVFTAAATKAGYVFSQTRDGVIAEYNPELAKAVETDATVGDGGMAEPIVTPEERELLLIVAKTIFDEEPVNAPLQAKELIRLIESERNPLKECGVCESCFGDGNAPHTCCTSPKEAAISASERELVGALRAISNRCYEWTMREPLEIVTHGGVLHAAPIGEIKQIADAVLAKRGRK